MLVVIKISKTHAQFQNTIFILLNDVVVLFNVNRIFCTTIVMLLLSLGKGRTYLYKTSRDGASKICYLFSSVTCSTPARPTCRLMSCSVQHIPHEGRLPLARSTVVLCYGKIKAYIISQLILAAFEIKINKKDLKKQNRRD